MKEVTSGIQHRARRIIDRHNGMKAEKVNWLNLWEYMGQYVMTRKRHFTTSSIPGEILTNDIFDSTAISANSLMAASLIGAMWPNGAKSFSIGLPFGMEHELGTETEEVKDYYQFVTKRMAEFMDNPKSGFITALEEYMLDQGAFGISGIISEEQEDDPEVPIAYKAVDAKSMCIDEGANGFVNTIYVERKYTVRQLVEKYGYENISTRYQKAFDQGDTKTTVMVLQAIEPRMDRDPYGFGVKNMPYASIHIDLSTEKILLESGYHELPLAITRFWKAMGEKYGRSPGMNALSDILEANALGNAWSLAVEKTLDPSLLVMDDGTMGGGVIDTSPGAINVVSVSGRVANNHRPIEPLFLVGDLKWTAARRTELIELIKNHFFQDRLTDLNNEQRMTLGEANIRNELRGMTLNTVYSRQMSEQFTPTIERTFNVLYRRGYLGVERGSDKEIHLLNEGITPTYIPDAVVQRIRQNREVYKINFISPATRIMQSEELQGIEHLITVTGNVAPVAPTVMDLVDMDFIVRRIQELTGAPRESVNSMETVRKLRAARQQAQNQQMQLEQQKQQSEIARNGAQAIATVSGGQKKGAA